MNTRQPIADGLSIRYAEADGAGDKNVLLLNPWPKSLLAWDTIRPRLAQTARLVNAEFLHARLTHSKLDILDTGCHTREEGADDYLALTVSWIEAHSTVRSGA